MQSLRQQLSISDDVVLVILMLVLIVVPRALQRYRIPAAITSLLLGFAARQLDLIPPSPAIRMFSTLGIVALFLFAGLEIDAKELRRDGRVLVQHGAIWSVLLGLTAVAAMYILAIDVRASILVALAILTPSAGFILSSLQSGRFSADEKFAIKTKAIAAELLALLAMFFVLQSRSAATFGMSLLGIAAILVVLPLTFRFFAAVVAPYAPRSEFAFLLGVAIVAALITRELGVYYLLGAFLVGVAAQRFRTKLPALSSDSMVHALEAFGSVFVPFYFFAAGMRIEAAQTGAWALAFGASLLAVFVPLRIAITTWHRRWAVQELGPSSRRIATALVPTLVFTLVLAEILRDQFGAPDFVVGALVIYAIVNTSVPGFVSLSARALEPAPVDAPVQLPELDASSFTSSLGAGAQR